MSVSVCVYVCMHLYVCINIEIYGHKKVFV